jgi:non-specific serine/threonine protein kinase
MEASLPTPIEEAAAATAGGKLYVMGGFDPSGRSLATVYVFDGSTWQAGPGLPLPVDHPSAATLDGSVYLSGGHSFGRDSARLVRLDGAGWTELASMHYARGGHALVAAQGRLYAIGGNTTGGNVGPAEVYDPAANAWTTLAALPAPRNHVSGFVIESNVCVVGGRAPTTARIDCFETVHSTWTRIADIPRATSGGGATAFPGGGVVVMGGENAQETAVIDQVTRYLGTPGWSTGDAMLVPRHGFELAVFQDRAWACGGGTSPGLYPVATCTSIANPTPLRR